MYRTAKKITTAVALLGSGVCFQLGGCSAVDALGTTVRNINPCGTILNCDPRLYQFATSGIDGPGVNPDVDPFCTFPPFCTADVDPIFGGLLFGGGG